MINYFDTKDSNFNEDLKLLISNSNEPDKLVVNSVSQIIEDVRNNGDAALLRYTNKLDRRNAKLEDIEIKKEDLDIALNRIPKDLKDSLFFASERICNFHKKQKRDSWSYVDDYGNVLGQKITPLDSVGVYVPGGKAAYPSSVLMNVIPANVAGVKEIIMVVPMPNDELSDLVLAAAAIVGVTRVFTVGGAQAIAALAYGTKLIPKVDKIVGPGNIYVATAKRQVFGQVGIDMIAGPSEILILNDGSGVPDWVAMDMFAQAEHDRLATAILISTSSKFISEVSSSIDKLLPTMKRADIIKASLYSNGAFIKVKNLEEAADISNLIAPEHLELSVDDPDSILPLIKHAGAIFMGHYATESLGDYCAGPNHVLPTASTAKFSSPLGVYDFQKQSSLIKCSSTSVVEIANRASMLANGEGLIAHANSADYRVGIK